MEALTLHGTALLAREALGRSRRVRWVTAMVSAAASCLLFLGSLNLAASCSSSSKAALGLKMADAA